ncbi:hypothetical protein ACFSC3_04765 [Sphingomonas floccifaciens]|uniref:Lipoprotein n=1 Tax=Sphingomonas floccifaciens TaxID=1844115 RepID=A0ABW4NBM1_9SPHN
MKIALLPLLALAGCTASAPINGKTDAAELADALKGRTAGPPQRCINASNLDAPRIIGDTLVYRQGGRLFVTRASGGCPSLRGDPLLVTEVYGGQLCRNDRFRTVPRGASIPGPYCMFGEFVPYGRVK